ncbi:MAG: 4-alpha-glucanotransferase [Collinsella sp.]|nr:4-alpha-glucanotransferase [Collinsella sp.]
MRRAGILMPVSSLPSPHGIGTLGAAARGFLDFMREAGQSVWQVLPIGPTGFGDSPYQSFSSFAGNPYLIDLDDLASEGLLAPEEYEGLPWGDDPLRVDYGALYRLRLPVLARAVARLRRERAAELAAFCERERGWLDDYALFMALKARFDGRPWGMWPDPYRLREPAALAGARAELAEEIALWQGVQFLFFHQWEALRAHAAAAGVEILGDLPIYAAGDSADTWAAPEAFQLDDDLRPTEVAGCPPDGFSATGQLWGNPLFAWDRMAEDGYAWWIRRIAFQFRLYDILRIDHFRGFDSYYAIPAGAADARDGRWREGPGIAFFRALEEELGPRAIIAEDLGFLTPSVRELLAGTGYPGMKVLEFAFDRRDGGGRTYQPHAYPRNCVAYVGTHDNDTALGWLDTADPADAALARDYLRLTPAEGEGWGMMRGIWSSAADLAIVQMQDLLGLGSEARMNIPSTLGGNWCWRAETGFADGALAARIAAEMELYERLPETFYKEKGRAGMTLEDRFERALGELGDPADPTDADLLHALMAAVRDLTLDMPAPAGDRKLYYFSAEFLVGRLLRANLINLGLVEEAEALLARFGRTLAAVEDREPEPSLGNGGLGRLAACFLDSIASLGLAGDGVGLNYHFGLFRQNLGSGSQVEEADPWIEPSSWLIDTGTSFTVPFGGFDLTARLFDIEVPGYRNGVCNRLHLFDVESPAPAPEHGIDFDKTDIAHRLTSFLYPDDSDEAGRMLRVYQQYFMVSAGAQLILAELDAAGRDVRELDRHVAIQINDTHPSLVIPELIRLLLERGLTFDEAAGIVERTCAYTNHTILAEALETWPASFLSHVAPQVMPIIRQLDTRAAARGGSGPLAIIDAAGAVHMAHMDIHFSHKVNGVAALHTEILKNTEMSGFNELYPGKFTNKTNGVTFRRWLMGANPALASLISERIGEGWKSDPSELALLADQVADDALIDALAEVKAGNKRAFAAWLSGEQGVELDPDSIFDVQIKRLHQYKRQQMNVLYAIWKYREIKAGWRPARPLTMVFAAKAAPAYTLAKDTIHLICTLGELIAADPEVAPWLKVVMIENYNVTVAEHLIPAADISEQISLASKEASGTGNMKLMANGALTLGTLDGANVEIADLVGEDAIYLFGRRSEEVIDLYRTGGYVSAELYERPAIKPLVDFITSPRLLEIGDAESLNRVRDDLIGSDYFMALLDLEDYIEQKERCLADYEDARAWGRRALVNIARSGYFSSDRTIEEYNRDIWHLDRAE